MFRIYIFVSLTKPTCIEICIYIIFSLSWFTGIMLRIYIIVDPIQSTYIKLCICIIVSSI